MSDESRSKTGRKMDGTTQEILRLLKRDSPVSRADLVRASGLTAPTVSASMAKLMRRNLAIELGLGSSSGGRPPGLFEFNARQGFVVGVDVGGSSVRVALADLSGSFVGRWNARLKGDRSPDAVTALVGSGVQQLLQQHKIPARRVLELVAGAPGITDVTAGRVLSAPNLTGWHHVPFCDLLQAETGIPTTVENDVNLGALGESWQGSARGVSNFIFLAAGTGVGAGIVLNGRLHHGATWSAGEVGYLLLPGLPKAPLGTNNLGALEGVVGGKRIEQAWTKGRDTAEGATKPPTATQIFDLAASGDPSAEVVLEEVAEYLAMAVTNMSLLLDVSVVVLGGGVGEHPALLEAIRRRVDRNEFCRPQVVLSSLGGEAQIHGAIWQGLQLAESHGYSSRTVRSAGVSFKQSSFVS